MPRMHMEEDNSPLGKKIQSALKAPFTVKSWRDHRESSGKGCGVAKAMSAMGGLGMDDQGSLAKIEDGKLKAAVQGYENVLGTAIEKAMGKSKRSPFTYELCKAMLGEMNKHLKHARKRLAVIEQNAKQKYAKEQLEKRKKAEALKADKELAGLLKDMAVQMSKLKTVFDNAAASMTKAHIDMKKVMASEALKGQEKVNVLENVLEKADKAYSKPVESAGKMLNSNIKLRKTMGKVTKESSPTTQKMEVQFNKVVEALKLARAKAQGANSEATSFLEGAVNALKKNENAGFASV